ncbi:hypothetical protein FRC07_007147 [Ceratobasidium sp. 392]|nr:hypothetical protein FRC07_007147 [Ceratobasidium sp. 392]
MSDPPAYAPLSSPGTYRISSVVDKNSVLDVLHYNDERVQVAPWVDKPNQHWIVQHSGRGFKIKNRQYGRYLSPPNQKYGAIVGTSETPMVWILLRTHVGLAIQCGETDYVIDLHSGLSHHGNVVLLWPSGELSNNRRWIFERISDDTGGEVADTIENEIDRLKHELQAKNAQLALQAEELAKKDQQWAEQSQTLGAALRQVYDSQSKAGWMADKFIKLSRPKLGRPISTCYDEAPSDLSEWHTLGTQKVSLDS